MIDNTALCRQESENRFELSVNSQKVDLLDKREKSCLKRRHMSERQRVKLTASHRQSITVVALHLPQIISNITIE